MHHWYALAALLSVGSLAVACGAAPSSGPGTEDSTPLAAAPATTTAVLKPSTAPPSPASTSPPVWIAIALTDMPAGATYKGEDGGLYGGGLNEPPEQHRLAAEQALREVVPRDAEGAPSPDGRIGFISVGFSNTNLEFRAFMGLASDDPDRARSIEMVNGAQPGMVPARWAARNRSDPWDVLAERIADQGLTPQQVQVVWLKAATMRPSEEFPGEVVQLHRDLRTVVQRITEKYPDARAVYLASRTFGGYATTDLTPEPHAYETAFAVRRLIQEQMTGIPDLNYDPGRGPVRAPFLLWGPYLWAEGLNARNDGLTWERGDFADDGTHPNAAGQGKVAQLLLDFFKTDSLARSWFVGAR